jgi:Uma2 family endonuclease
MALPREKIRTYTEEEYLSLEREADERHEYIDGYIYAMAGESDEHGDICVNLVRELSTALKGKPCKVKTKDTKVRSGPLPSIKNSIKGLYSYPDVIVICGEPQFLDKHKEVVTNPTVIIEVLSDSTEQFDRIEKFFRYKNWCPSLKEYLLVWQNAPIVEHYSCYEKDVWRYGVYYGTDSSFVINSIETTMLLSEIFDRVSFPPTDEKKMKEVFSNVTEIQRNKKPRRAKKDRSKIE